MSKLLNKVKSFSFVAHVDDEREIGNGIIVSLSDNWCFRCDPTCGVRGFDTISEVYREVRKCNVYRESMNR